MSSYRPSYEDRKINTEAARIASKSPVMDKVAAGVLASIKAVAERHRQSGDYGRSLEIAKTRGRHGVEDRFVHSTDPKAVALEYGHFAGKTGTEGRPYVQGRFIMTQAANSFRKGN